MFYYYSSDCTNNFLIKIAVSIIRFVTTDRSKKNLDIQEKVVKRKQENKHTHIELQIPVERSMLVYTTPSVFNPENLRDHNISVRWKCNNARHINLMRETRIDIVNYDGKRSFVFAIIPSVCRALSDPMCFFFLSLSVIRRGI